MDEWHSEIKTLTACPIFLGLFKIIGVLVLRILVILLSKIYKDAEQFDPKAVNTQVETFFQ